MTDEPSAEAREVLAWQESDGSMRTLTWVTGGPVLEVRTEGEWRAATVVQRQDRRAGTAYAVTLILPSVSTTSSCHRTYAWDPGCMRPRHPATTDPVQHAT